MMKYLARIAMQKGVSGFAAEILADNPRIMKIIHKIGESVETKMIDETYHVIIKFVP